ncbi:sn-glycerol-1-phosphate dehydrogenase [Hydrogenispora ethanolica]|uniref:sn-glycerol-1-phosphate dehydrogenase n=1 Tax=Hydrogenispora ethanolica TaxID=1082276 RepID=UPI0010441900|nr:sn-glycerol-1-phosphate dehydrogenase [Hydrogenispora ethanolica]
MNHSNEQPEKVCSCGRIHPLPIKEIVVERGALQQLSGCRERLGFGKKALLIADRNTMDLAGREAERILREDGCEVRVCLFDTDQKIIPNEQSLIKVLTEFDAATDFMVAAGSGTLNDLARYISSKVGRGYISLLTAPSMDGYTSVVAPLVINGFKKPWPATYPTAVYADPAILRNAPLAMIAAGFGDLIGKVIGRADWVLSKIINGEYYCQQAVDLVQKTVDECIAGAGRFITRDEAAIASLTRGLIDAGIAMLWVGNSRPASGSEHLLAQFWEMKSIMRGEFKHFHGDEVAVGTVLMSKLYAKLFTLDLSRVDLERAADRLSNRGRWEAMVKDVYGPLAGEVFKENEPRSFARQDVLAGIERAVNTAEEWRSAIQAFMLSPEYLTEMLRKVGAPYRPEDLDLDKARTREGVLASQASRMRYTILETADQLGCLEELADEIC